MQWSKTILSLLHNVWGFMWGNLKGFGHFPDGSDGKESV